MVDPGYINEPHEEPRKAGTLTAYHWGEQMKDLDHARLSLPERPDSVNDKPLYGAWPRCGLPDAHGWSCCGYPGKCRRIEWANVDRTVTTKPS